MPDLDVEHLERRLLEERDQTLESIQQGEEEESEGQRESAGDVSRMPTHLADMASDTQEAEKDLANVNRETEQLNLIDDALRRLREDPAAFGLCEECGQGIEKKRLELIPWSRLCASCATGDEVSTASGSA